MKYRKEKVQGREKAEFMYCKICIKHGKDGVREPVCSNIKLQSLVKHERNQGNRQAAAIEKAAADYSPKKSAAASSLSQLFLCSVFVFSVTNACFLEGTLIFWREPWLQI